MTTPTSVDPRPLGRLATRILLAGLLLSLVATVVLLVQENDAFLMALIVLAGFGLLLVGLPSVSFLVHSRRQPPPTVPRDARIAVWFSAIALVLFGLLLVATGGNVESLTDQVIGVVLGLTGIVTIVQVLRFRAPASGDTRLVYGRSSVVGAVFFFLVVVMIPKFACGCGTKGKAYQAAVKSDLRNLVTAEEAYFADHKTFALRAQLDKDSLFYASSGDTIVVVAADAHGWSATGTHWNLGDVTCGIWVGTKPADGMHNARESQPVCWKEKS
jgi:uncharacterized membrane protein HdeD (DUF308 family)